MQTVQIEKILLRCKFKESQKLVPILFDNSHTMEYFLQIDNNARLSPDNIQALVIDGLSSGEATGQLKGQLIRAVRIGEVGLVEKILPVAERQYLYADVIFESFAVVELFFEATQQDRSAYRTFSHGQQRYSIQRLFPSSSVLQKVAHRILVTQQQTAQQPVKTLFGQLQAGLQSFFSK